MRVVLLGPSRNAVSGVSTHLNQLFSSSLARSFDLLQFQVGSEGRRESLLSKLFRFVASPLVFWFYLLRCRPAIVHINTSLEQKSYWRDVAYLLAARSLGCKIVYQVHGGALPEAFFSGRRFLTTILRRVLALPDIVVLLAQIELAAYRTFVPSQWIEVVANALDASSLLSRSLDGKGRGSLHLVYLGRIAENKGIFDIAESMAILISRGRNLHLTVAGGGPDELRLKQRIGELELNDHVHFAGALFGDAKDDLWNVGDVFVFPTFHREGLPYALLEAMASGAVPVTTRTGAIPDVMEEGVHGLFVEPRDPDGLAQAIAYLDDERAALARMAVAGRRRVAEGYTVERLAADFARIYRTLDARN